MKTIVEGLDLTNFILGGVPKGGQKVEGPCGMEACTRYLKNLYNSNYDRFQERFLKPLNQWLSMNDIKQKDSIVQAYDKMFQYLEPFGYLEAFSIKDDNFRALVFSAINVPEMIQNLGTQRIKTSGIDLINKVWNPFKEQFEDVPLTQVYEVHKVNGKQLQLRDIYALKCWCTSTNNEHWMWLDRKYDDPLEAIASLCKIYKPMVGKIRHIIRQGDVFLFEMKEEVTVLETDEIVTLPKDQYFKLLKSQS